MTDLTITAAVPPARAPRGWRRLSILSWLALARSRRQLARLDRARLDDLGISPEAARKEAARPIWDAPATWRE